MAGPRALINMNDNFGGGTAITRNLLFDSLRETHDHGPYNSWDRLPYITTVRNGTPSMVPAFNHIDSNMIFGNGGEDGLDTDDGTDMLNATNNVLYLCGLWKTDFGGHTKTYSGNLDIYGLPRSCGPSGQASKYERDGSTDVFYNNTCVNSPSNVLNCNLVTTAVIHDNTYYVTNGTGKDAVCPGNGDGKLEHGSYEYPLSDATTGKILAQAKQILGL